MSDLSHCYICQSYKYKSDFYPDHTRTSGVSSRCKYCCNRRIRTKKGNPGIQILTDVWKGHRNLHGRIKGVKR